MNFPNPAPDPKEGPATQPRLPLTPRETVRKLILGLGLAAKDHIAVAERLLADPPRAEFDQTVDLPPGKTRQEHLGALRKFIRQLRALDMEADHSYRELSQAPSPKREDHRRRLDDIEGRIQRFLPRFRLSWNTLMETAAAAEYILDSMRDCLPKPGGSPVLEEPVRGPGWNPALRLHDLEDLMRMPFPELETRMRQIRTILEQGLKASPSITPDGPT